MNLRVQSRESALFVAGGVGAKLNGILTSFDAQLFSRCAWVFIFFTTVLGGCKRKRFKLQIMAWTGPGKKKKERKIKMKKNDTARKFMIPGYGNKMFVCAFRDVSAIVRTSSQRNELPMARPVHPKPAVKSHRHVQKLLTLTS